MDRISTKNFGIDLKGFKVSGKTKMLKNMFSPEIGKIILDSYLKRPGIFQTEFNF